MRRHPGSNNCVKGGRVPPLYPLTRAHEVDSATRSGRHLASPIPFSLNSVRGRGDRCVGRRSDPFGPAGRRCSCWPTVAIGATMELGARRRRAGVIANRQNERLAVWGLACNIGSNDKWQVGNLA